MQHFSALHRQAGLSAVYSRGGDICELDVVSGRTQAEDYSNEGLPTTAETDDWLCRADKLKLDGVQTLPELQDKLEVYSGEEKLATYSVVEGPGDRCYRFSDNQKQLLRIYTVLVEAI